MKINTSHLVGAAIALAAVFFSKLDAQDALPETQPKQWRYKIEVDVRGGTNDFQEKLTQASSTGWELFSLRPNARNNGYVIIWKRPAQ